VLELKGPKEMPEPKLGAKTYTEITQDASNRVEALGNAIDNGVPKVLDVASLALLPVAPEVSAVLSYISTAWTIKNDMKTGDFTNTGVSATTLILSSSPSKAFRFGVQAGQVLYDNGYFQKGSATPQNIKDAMQGKNLKKDLERYRALGNYGF